MNFRQTPDAVIGCFALAAACFLGLSGPASAAIDVCRVHTDAAEQRNAIPDGLLGAIALAETGRWDEAAGETRAWPWTVMAKGVGTYHPTKHAALAHVAELRAEGVTNIDVGCMQVNLGYHGHRFAGVAEAIDPARNVAYAARFLIEKHGQAESWIEAASHYHSMTPHLAAKYRAKVERLWAALPDGKTTKDGWGADVATAEAVREPTYVVPNTAVNHSLMDRLNQSFKQRRAARTASAGAITAAGAGTSNQVMAWRQARAAQGTSAPGVHDLYGQGVSLGGGQVGSPAGGSGSLFPSAQSGVADGGPMASLNAANASMIDALIRRTEAQAQERAALRNTGRSATSFARKRQNDLAYWRSRYGLDG